MTSGHVFIATSVDGFIARPDGDVSWLHGVDDPGEDYGYAAFIAHIDALIMGRGSFEKVLSFQPWPYDRPVVVLSRTLAAADIPPALTGKVEVVDASPAEAMRLAEARGWGHVYVDGGAVITSFLREGLIEDLVISRIPVLIGSGIPLFGALPADIALEHTETTAYASGLVQSRYRVRKS